MGAAFRRAGFTLIEVLLTLSILAVIMILLLSAFTGASRARSGLISRGRDTRQIMIAMERIGTELQGAFTSTKWPDSELIYREEKMVGTVAGALVFTAFQIPSIGDGYPPSSIIRVAYLSKVGEDGASIELYRRQADLPFIENQIPIREARLAEKLKGFRVEFYDGVSWQSEWPAGRPRTSLPKRIAITIIDNRDIEYRREIPLHLSGQDSVIQSGSRSGKSQSESQSQPESQPESQSP